MNTNIYTYIHNGYAANVEKKKSTSRLGAAQIYLGLLDFFYIWAAPGYIYKLSAPEFRSRFFYVWF